MMTDASDHEADAAAARLGIGDSRLLGELLALLSHDLRNPLAALHSNLGYLGSVLGTKDEEVSEAIADGVVSCDSLSHIIDNVDLLGVALRTAEQRYTGPSPVGAVVTAAVERCRSAAGSHGLLIEVAEGTPRVSAMIAAPRELLVRALSNLIRNSVQHAPPASTVRVSALSADGFAEVVVEDRGLPIPQALHDSAFSAAGQVEGKSRSNCRYSRGLGLLSARLAATLCGGRIVVGGSEGIEGNRFRLICPAVVR
jgi:signal transduction histidine kinase